MYECNNNTAHPDLTIGQSTQATSLCQDWNHIMWNKLIYKTVRFSSAESVMGQDGKDEGLEVKCSLSQPLSHFIRQQSAYPRDCIFKQQSAPLRYLP
jgi:hypothetical protein